MVVASALFIVVVVASMGMWRCVEESKNEENIIIAECGQYKEGESAITAKEKVKHTRKLRWNVNREGSREVIYISKGSMRFCGSEWLCVVFLEKGIVSRKKISKGYQHCIF